MKKDNIIVEGKTQGNLYLILLKLREKLHASLVDNDYNLFHRRMGHLCKFPPTELCDVCLDKHHRDPYKSLEGEGKTT